tara:strand:- start:399 stop:674 length:276 start_codon:yes stop_codon:yes gene_type:complete
MILTELFTGRFLCVVNTTPEILVEQMEGVGGLDTLVEMIPKLKDMGITEGVDVVLTPINIGVNVAIYWSIDIFGDDGMVELILAKNPKEWN